MIKVFSTKKQKIGLIGEDFAVDHIKIMGFLNIERNINTKFGEIDIMANKSNLTYFFEVKTSYLYSKVSSGENITKSKLLKFQKAVQFISLSRGIQNFKIGFILVILNSDHSLNKIDLFFE